MAQESEQALVERAKSALSHCNWEIGECAALWTKRHAKGRTDADFGAMIGLSADQVYQRRRVWESFADVREQYMHLRWSHFYAAVTWDDAPECLKWADDLQATVAEMRAWRRAQHGEDLTADSTSDGAGTHAESELLPFEAGFVHDLADGAASAGESSRHRGSRRGEESLAVAGVAREAHGDGDYAPFGSRARGEAPAAGSREPASAESAVRRVATALERCDAALTPAILDEFDSLPSSLRRQVLQSVASLSSKLAGFQS